MLATSNFQQKKVHFCVLNYFNPYPKSIINIIINQTSWIVEIELNEKSNHPKRSGVSKTESTTAWTFSIVVNLLLLSQRDLVRNLRLSAPFSGSFPSLENLAVSVPKAR